VSALLPSAAAELRSTLRLARRQGAINRGSERSQTTIRGGTREAATPLSNSRARPCQPSRDCELQHRCRYGKRFDVGRLCNKTFGFFAVADQVGAGPYAEQSRGTLTSHATMPAHNSALLSAWWVSDRGGTTMPLAVWLIEFVKLLGKRRLHPLNAECPICHRMVRLHYNKAGRRHIFAHARAYSRTLYEGSRYCAHYTAKIKCVGSGMQAKFEPRPNEPQHFNAPKSLGIESR